MGFPKPYFPAQIALQNKNNNTTFNSDNLHTDTNVVNGQKCYIWQNTGKHTVITHSHKCILKQ